MGALQQTKEDKSEAMDLHSTGSRLPASSHPMLRLQRLGGNQAVQELLGAGVIRAKRGRVLGEDAEEREAERVGKALARRATPVCECGGTCAECRARASMRSHRRLTRASSPGPSSSASHPAALGGVLRQLGTGRPLEPRLRDLFEPALGTDLSAVRVHDDAAATTAARSIDAKAFTYGHDVVFGNGGFDAQSTAGRELIGHELTHVAQQAGASRKLQRQQLDPLTPAVGDTLQVREPYRVGNIELLGSIEFAAGQPVIARSEPQGSMITVALAAGSIDVGWATGSPDWEIPFAVPFAVPLAILEPAEVPASEQPEGRFQFGSQAELSTLYTLRSDVSARGGVLTYGFNRQIFLDVAPEMWTGKVPFAFQFLPSTALRSAPVIRIVAGPGVSIRLEGWPLFHAASLGNPALQIFRVQDPESVPRQGTAIDPSLYTGMQAVSSEESETPYFLPPRSPVVVVRRPDGVDIIHRDSGEVLAITAPNLLGDAGFAYDIDLPAPEPLLNPVASLLFGIKLRIVKTPAVRILLRYRRAFRLGGNVGRAGALLPLIYEVPRVDMVPAQGTSIPETGDHLRSVPAQAYESLGHTLGTTAIDVGFGFLPIAGDAIDIAEFALGLFKGYDRWGRPLSALDLVVLGIGAALPLVGGAALRGGLRAARGGARGAEEMTDLVRAAQSLTAAERAEIERWNRAIRGGGELSETEAAAAARLVRRLDDAARATSEAGRAGRAGYPTLDQILNAERSGFTDPEIQAGYRRYMAGRAEQVSPEEWVRRTRGAPQDLLARVLGPENFRTARSGTTTVARIDPQDLEALGTLAVIGKNATSHGRWINSLPTGIPLLRNLDTAALGRILAKGPNVDHIKGQLLEELLSSHAECMATDLARRTGGDFEFIPGHRISDAAGAQLTDGVIVRRTGSRVEIVVVFESKAGRATARDLRSSYTSFSDLNAGELAHLQAEAIEELRLTDRSFANMTSQQLAQTHPSWIEARMRAINSSDAGQVRRDIERLVPNVGAETVPIKIDNELVEVVASPSSTKVVGLVPSDVSLGHLAQDLGEQGLRFEGMTVPINQKQLQSTAETLRAELVVNGSRLAE